MMQGWFSNQKGFSLVELLVTMVITAVIGTAILTLYTRSLRTYSGQLQVTEAQQNIRAGLDSIVYDLRMAGFDPVATADAGLVSVDPDGDGIMNSIQFTMDLTDDADTGDPDGNLVDAVSGLPDAGENVTYDLYLSAGIMRLGRDSGSGNQPVAEYLETNGLGFAYAFDNDGDGVLDADANDQTHWAIIGANGNWWELDANNDGEITLADDTNGDGAIDTADTIGANPPVDTGITADLADIRAVKIWLLGRAPQTAQDYTNTNSYLVGSQVVTAANDSFRRRLLTTSVYCRNLGI